MMIRFLFFLSQIAIIIGISVYISESPNSVIIEWDKWRIDTSVGMLLILLCILAVFCYWLLKLYYFIIGAPEKIMAWRRERKLIAAQKLNFQAISAIYAGNANEAIACSQNANNLIDNELSRLLIAQAYELDNNFAMALQTYQELMAYPNSAFVAAQGQIKIRLTMGADNESLKELLEFADSIKPNALSILNIRLEIAVKEQNFNLALKILERKKDCKFLNETEFKEKASDLLLAQANNEEGEKAFTTAMRALKYQKGHLRASIYLAQNYIAKKSYKEAQEILKKAFEIKPDRVLAELWLQASPKKLTALKSISYLEELTELHPNSPICHSIMLEKAINAGLPGFAKRHAAELQNKQNDPYITELLQQFKNSTE